MPAKGTLVASARRAAEIVKCLVFLMVATLQAAGQGFRSDR
jgi:hypothetical protein